MADESLTMPSAEANFPIGVNVVLRMLLGNGQLAMDTHLRGRDVVFEKIMNETWIKVLDGQKRMLAMFPSDFVAAIAPLNAQPNVIIPNANNQAN